jgi:hypothetical protein
MWLLMWVVIASACNKCEHLNATECELHCACVMYKHSCLCATDGFTNHTDECNPSDSTAIIVACSLAVAGIAALVCWCTLDHCRQRGYTRF